MPSHHWCTPPLRDRLMRFGQILIDQQRARILIEPQRRQPGHWFGGGNMIRHPNGHLYLVGRYRNAGDSRTGIAAGERGLELAIFKSDDDGASFHKILSWSKESIQTSTGPVLSIEGSCLRQTCSGIELYVSTEKSGVRYPASVSAWLKPGAGVWSIDVLRADTVEQLRDADVSPFLASDDPSHLHVKDPFVWPTATGDQIGFCSHPFNWSSSNTGRIQPGKDIGESAQFSIVPRGTTWDVAMTRGTSVVTVPPEVSGMAMPIQLLFYCGGECVRQLDEHPQAVVRPRGYSCEELGGVMAFPADAPSDHVRLSELSPMFISPKGTGCSRYHSVLQTPDGYIATWQQSQPDQSQPLVMNYASHSDLSKFLPQF